MTDMTDTTTDTTTLTFAQLGLAEPVLKAVLELGYETPSPIQLAAIPAMLAGRDILGQAQTGTGKTAAFALPLLSNLDPEVRTVQALVLTPTRELAQQVAESIENYGKHLRGMRVLAIYGGAAFGPQLKSLERGVQVVVGTPGRIMDHLRRGTLKLDHIRTLVLDEADEMLNMGFQEDVEWIMGHVPETRQTALLSATLPPAIRKLVDKYLDNPERIQITQKKQTVETISQSFWMVSHHHKLDAFGHLLDRVEFDAAICFVRTRGAADELANVLRSRGLAASSLHGDMQQRERDRAVEALKNGDLDIIIATDVAARGLDVPRISLVINYDIPTDPEAYVHRIGRTGRAGRDGAAILLVTPRERRLLQTIERMTGQVMQAFKLPSADDVANRRVGKMFEAIEQRFAGQDLSFYADLVNQFLGQNGKDPELLAAALMSMVETEENLRPRDLPDFSAPERNSRDRDSRDSRDRPRREESPGRRRDAADVPMATYRVEVGRQHNVKPGNLVGAIANEAGLESRHIGNIRLNDGFSLVDLPAEIPADVFNHLKRVRVCGQPLNIVRDAGGQGGSQAAAPFDGRREPRAPRGDAPRSFDDRPRAPRRDGERSNDRAPRRRD